MLSRQLITIPSTPRHVARRRTTRRKPVLRERIARAGCSRKLSIAHLNIIVSIIRYIRSLNFIIIRYQSGMTRPWIVRLWLQRMSRHSHVHRPYLLHLRHAPSLLLLCVLLP